MLDDHDRQRASVPRFDDDQWDYILRQDTLMTQIVKHTAMLELLTTYYHEITAALDRHPSPELRALRTNTVARIQEVAASGRQVLAEMAQVELPADAAGI